MFERVCVRVVHVCVCVCVCVCVYMRAKKVREGVFNILVSLVTIVRMEGECERWDKIID